MKAHAALERADRRAVLYAPAAVHMGLAGVIGPGHAELDHPLRLHQTLQQAVFQVAGVTLQERPQALDHFFHGLQEFRLMRITLGHVVEKVV